MHRLAFSPGPALPAHAAHAAFFAAPGGNIPQAANPVAVVLAHSQEDVRAAIHNELEAVPGVRVIAEVATSEELLALMELVRPDVIITDLLMQGLQGLALRTIRARQPQLRVLPVSRFVAPTFVPRVVTTSTDHQLLKDAWAQELHQAVRGDRACNDAPFVAAPVATAAPAPAERVPGSALTVRQIEILQLLAQGMSSRQIGLALNLSARTVDTHRGRIMARVGVHDVASLTRYAVREGLVKP